MASLWDPYMESLRNPCGIPLEDPMECLACQPASQPASHGILMKSRWNPNGITHNPYGRIPMESLWNPYGILDTDIDIDIDI